MAKTTPRNAYRIAHDLVFYGKQSLKDKSPELIEAEIAIKPSPEYSYKYAKEVIQGRWEEAEESIISNPEYAYLYAKEIIKGRWEEAEESIISNPEYACIYAKEIIKGRWEEAEESIASDPYFVCLYYRYVVEEKLPEDLHNVMIANSLVDNGSRVNQLIKIYFNDISPDSKKDQTSGLNKILLESL